MVIPLFSLTFTSCGDDEKDEPTPTPNPNGNGSIENIELQLTKFVWYVKTEDFWGGKYHDTLHEWYYFLGNGKGVKDVYQISESIYGDKDRSRYTKYFTYAVEDNLVYITIDSNKAAYPYNTTSLGSGDYILTAREMTEDDKERFQSAIYETMDDDERLDFTIGFINEENQIEECPEAGYKYKSYLTFGFSIEESEHIYSRLISEIRCRFSIEGGGFYWQQDKVDLNIFISSDEDQIVVDGPFEIYRNENAKLIVDIYNFDNKINKERYINTIEFPFENNPNLGGDNSGNY